MAAKNKFYLRVEEAFTEDVNKGVARIDPVVSSSIGLSEGDYIEIKANKTPLFHYNSSCVQNEYIENYNGFNFFENDYITIKVDSSTPTTTEKVIKINYNINKPSSFYCALYSSATESDEIGDVDIEFYDSNNTLLGTYQPFVINKDLNFSVTPSYILLRQKSTKPSKISKYSILIN